MKYILKQATRECIAILLLATGTNIGASEEKQAFHSAQISLPPLVTLWREAGAHSKQEELTAKTESRSPSFTHVSLPQHVVRQKLINLLAITTELLLPLSSITVDYLYGKWKDYATVPMIPVQSKHVAFAVYKGRQVLLTSGTDPRNSTDRDSDDEEDTVHNPLNIWDLKTGRLSAQLSIGKGEPCEFQATSDGTQIIICSRYRIYGYDTHTGNKLFQAKLPIPYSRNILCTGLSTFAIDTQNSLIAAALLADKNIPLTLLKLESTGIVQSTLTILHHGICQLCFSPNSKLLATRSLEGEITIWDLATQESLHQWPHGDYSLFGESFFFKSNTCLATSTKGIIQEWDLPKLESSVLPSTTSKNNCQYLQKALNSRTTAYAIVDKEKRYVEVEEDGDSPFITRLEVGNSLPAALAPDGDYFATVANRAQNPVAHIWQKSYDIQEPASIPTK